MIICEFRLHCAITLVLIVISKFIFITPNVSDLEEVENGSFIAPSVELSLLTRRGCDVITRLVLGGDNLVKAQAPMGLSLFTFQAV